MNKQPLTSREVWERIAELLGEDFSDCQKVVVTLELNKAVRLETHKTLRHAVAPILDFRPATPAVGKGIKG